MSESGMLQTLKQDSVFSGALGLVNSVERKTTKAGKTYYDMTVSDSSATLSLRIWGDAKVAADGAYYSAEASADYLAALRGHVISFSGSTGEYQGQTQYTVRELQFRQDVNPTDYMPVSPVPLDKLLSDFDTLVDSIPSVGVRTFLADFRVNASLWSAFSTLPAAVGNHHAYKYGLLEHSVHVAQLVCHMATAIPDVNWSTAVAGAILHDLGKVDAYTMVAAPEVTLLGSAMDHIAPGYARFMTLVGSGTCCMTQEEIVEIGHIILSHHGQKEFGSPVLPMTPAAFCVSHADMLDFQVNVWQRTFKDNTSQVSPYIPVLKSRLLQFGESGATV